MFSKEKAANVHSLQPRILLRMIYSKKTTSSLCKLYIKSYDLILIMEPTQRDGVTNLTSHKWNQSIWLEETGTLEEPQKRRWIELSFSTQIYYSLLFLRTVKIQNLFSSTSLDLAHVLMCMHVYIPVRDIKSEIWMCLY